MNAGATNYTASFYENLKTGVEHSAAVIVPIVLELTGAASVVDIGCGSGDWLKTFTANGVGDTVGVDGAWAATLMSGSEFVAADLTKPFSVPRVFDLAICLEVGEHLPDSAAATLVATLAGLAPVVVFSAAIPGQGGVDHINEQWPGYWAQLFDAHNYVAVDAIRPRVWSNTTVEYWYAQNTIVYVDRQQLARYPALLNAAQQTQSQQLALVHPRQYLAAVDAAGVPYFRPDARRFSLGTWLRIGPAVLRNAVVTRIRRTQG